MDKENQSQRQTTPIRHTYGGAQGVPGSQETYSFHLRGATTDERAQVENTIARLIEEHTSPQKIIYTTLTGHTADGRPFAVATLLPVGDTIQLTLGDNDDAGALGTTMSQLRRIVIYMLSAYLMVAYGMDMEDTQQMCDLADEQAEREEREEGKEAAERD